MKPGEKYHVKDTLMNKKHRLISGKDCYIAFIDPANIHLIVIQNGAHERFIVPRDMFAGNFTADPYPMPIATTYVSVTPFMSPPAKRYT